MLGTQPVMLTLHYVKFYIMLTDDDDLRLKDDESRTMIFVRL